MLTRLLSKSLEFRSACRCAFATRSTTFHFPNGQFGSNYPSNEEYINDLARQAYLQSVYDPKEMYFGEEQDDGPDCLDYPPNWEDIDQLAYEQIFGKTRGKKN